jgi:hypothetical protein
MTLSDMEQGGVTESLVMQLVRSKSLSGLANRSFLSRWAGTTTPPKMDLLAADASRRHLRSHH